MPRQGSASEAIHLRRATPADREAVIALCRASLGWRAEDPNEAFFAWKHDENPAGPSPAWVAEAEGGRLVGLRVFLRWRFRGPDGALRRAVRAVDTATHPDWQGRGIFTRLTLAAIPDLREEGIDFIFNTPNDKSRPGYLKMGWSEVGRVPINVRVGSFGSVPAVLRSRVPAELWSEPCDVGEPAGAVLADADAVGRLLDQLGTAPGVVTDRTPEFLHWRYRFGPLHYRVMPVGTDLEDGVILFRLRRRGPALECALGDVLARPGPARRRAIRHVLRRSGATHAIACGGPGWLGDGFLPAPGLGPVVTWRPICATGVPRMRQLGFTLGDLELF